MNAERAGHLDDASMLASLLMQTQATNLTELIADSKQSK
jgi:hypothetical protein